MSNVKCRKILKFPHCGLQNAIFFVLDTPITDIEDCLKKFIKRDDIDIILINQNIAELVRTTIDGHTAPVPSILEIPSKDHPYDPAKDSILRRAKGMFNPEDMR